MLSEVILKGMIPPTLPLFFKQRFKTWCEFVDFEPTKPSEIKNENKNNKNKNLFWIKHLQRGCDRV